MTSPQSEQDIFREVVLGMTTARQIAKAIVTPPPAASVSRRWGVITAVNSNGTVDLTISGVLTQGVKKMAWYAPTVGETVLLDIVNGDIIVVGVLAPNTKNDFNARISALSAQVSGLSGPGADPTGYLTTLDTPVEFPISTQLTRAPVNFFYNSSFLLWPRGGSPGVPVTSVSIAAGTDQFTAGGWVGASHSGPAVVASRFHPIKGGLQSVLSFTSVPQYHYVRQFVPTAAAFSSGFEGGNIYHMIADVTTDGTVGMDCYVQARVNANDADRELVVDSPTITLTGAGRRYVAIAFEFPNLFDNIETWDERSMIEVAWRWVSTSAATRTCTIHSVGFAPGRIAQFPGITSPAYDELIIEGYYEQGFTQVGGLTNTSGQKRAQTIYKTRKALGVVIGDITVKDLAGNAGKVSTYDIAGTRTDNVAYTALQGDTSSSFTYQNGFTIVINGSTASGIGYTWEVDNW